MLLYYSLSFKSGIYYFQLMDHYTASITIMFLAFCQMISIAWFYSIERLSKNVKQMTGKAPSLYLKFCWIMFGPCLLFVSYYELLGQVFQLNSSSFFRPFGFLV